MSKTSEQERIFNFRFNLHKTIFSIGIEDHDYARLQEVYGVDAQWMQQMVSEFAQSNAQNAQQLKEVCDLSAFSCRPLKIVFLGDSNTSNRQSYLNILKAATEDYPQLQLVDKAVSGFRSGDVLTIMHLGVVAEHADIVHIMIGANDIRRMADCEKLYLTSPAEYERNLDYIVSTFVKDGSRVILTTIPPFSKERSDKHFARSNGVFEEEDRQLYNAIIEKIAHKYGTYLNKMDELFARYTPEELTVPDGIHLAELGHSTLALGVARSILNLLGTEK